MPTKRIAVVAGIAVLAITVPAPAVTTQTVEFTARYSKGAKSKKRAGTSLRTVLRITDPAATAPLRLTRTVLRFPKGSVTNGRFFPKCSPEALQARGPRACPRGSLLGKGIGRGSAPPFIDVVNAKVSLYNGTLAGGNQRILIYSVPDIGPVLVFTGVLRKIRGARYGYELDTPIPRIPTLPNQPDAAVTYFDATVRDLTVRRRGRTIHYIDSPVVCDGTFFMLDGAFSYQGGTTNEVLERFTLRGGPRCP
jgi:hypothetical protein